MEDPRAGAAPPAGTPKAIKKTSDEDDDETLIKDLCTINGVNYDKLPMGGGQQKTRLEIFFFGFPRIVGLCHFPNLTYLCVMNQKIGKMSGLETCKHLEELWVCEGMIAKLEGLQHCTNLVKLYLYTNRISRIEGLSSLTRLETLWLNGNRIRTIEGIDNLAKLRDLNLAGNLISAIGRSLEGFQDLEQVNLSGNRLSSLKDLVHLCSLPKLHTLSLCEKLYPPNPLCKLCNYSTHTLYHLPALQWLDGIDVSSPELHRLIQGLVYKKKQFYRMKVHHTHQQARERCQRLRQKMAEARERTYSRMKRIHKQLKTLQYECEEMEGVDMRKQALTRRMMALENHVQTLERTCTEVCDSIDARMAEQHKQWLVELESGGNVKFIPGDPSIPWYKSCVELVGSRFSVADVQDLGVTGMQVTGVLRVENRMLYNRFNDRLNTLLEREPYVAMVQKHSYKQLLDYLFLIWKPGMDITSTCQEGCEKGIVAMTNSVTQADQPRLRQQGGGWVCQLVLCKVFLGQTSESKDSETPTRKAHPSADSVYRQKEPSSNMESHQREWFVFNHDLVLPEYIIQLKYTSQLYPSEPLDHVMSHDPAVGESDEELLGLDTIAPVRPKLAMLDEATILQITGIASLSNVKSLNLHDNHLTRLRLASSMPQLTTLILSFNDLTKIEDIQHLPNLTHLDLSFNRLSSLVGMRSLPKLCHLDVSWNELNSYHDNVNVLCKHTPALEMLDTRYNPWTKMELFRSYTLGRIKTLKQLDGTTVSQEESSIALRQVVTSHLSLTTLLSHAHTDTHPPPSLTLTPIAEMLHRESRNRPRQLSNSNSDWCSKVTSVCVCGVGLKKLSCLDQLPNLRWLSLADNALATIEGLALCIKLEELTLDNNLLQSLDAIQHLTQLKWLSVSGNKLQCLPREALPLLGKLEYLNVCSNGLSSLEGVQHLSSLVELYTSCNSVSSLRELFHLKSLSQLVVVDLSNNPLVAIETYRIFAVYHLLSLKTLNGDPVDSSELATAREKLGGRLTQDVIYERHPGVDFPSLKKLDLPNCGLKHIDLTPINSFDNLASLNLEHNSLTSLSGLIYLDKLKVLCLNHNRVECLLHSHEPQPPSNTVLHSLQVLHLAYNGISNLAALQLMRIPTLRALFLQGNEISHVEGLEGLQNLMELVLDRNKIKSLQEHSFSQLYLLRELHIEENRLRDLSHFSPLLSLQRLYLGSNRVQEFTELDKLGCLSQLLELSVISNPVSRRLQHRFLLIFKLPSLLSLDGVAITAEERHSAELSFTETQEPDVPSEVVLPCLSHTAPLKVMNVPVPFGRGSLQATTQSQRRRHLVEARTMHLQSLQAYHEKRKGRR